MSRDELMQLKRGDVIAPANTKWPMKLTFHHMRRKPTLRLTFDLGNGELMTIGPRPLWCFTKAETP